MIFVPAFPNRRKRQNVFFDAYNNVRDSKKERKKPQKLWKNRLTNP